MATNITNSNHMVRRSWVNGTGSAISAGDIVVVGALTSAILVVALVDIANGESGEVGYNCAVTAAKVSAGVWSQGESLSWDSSASAFDDGRATAAAGDVSGAASRAESDGAAAEVLTSVWLTGVPSALNP